MSVFVRPKMAPRLLVPEKAVLGPGAASMMTLAPIHGMIRNPQQMMRMAQMLFHSDRWVYKAEQTIDFAFSTVDWHLEDADDNEIEAESAQDVQLQALNLLEKPQANLGTNAQGLTRQQLWSITSRHMGLCGSAFWLGDRPDMLAKIPLSTIYINPARMTPAEDSHGNLTGWGLDWNANTQTGVPLSLEEVFHFKLNEPDEGHFGIGNVESAVSVDRLTKLADQHAADVLSSGGRLAGIVSAKSGGAIPDNVYQQMIRDFRTANDQPDSAKHNIVVQGPIEFTRQTATPAELDLLKLMSLSRDDTLAVWGVPLSQIGGQTPAGLNSGDVRKYDRAALWQNAVHPRLTAFWEVLQYQLLDRFQKLGAVIELEIEEPEFDDDSPRYDLLQKSINIAMTNAERRALIGLDPLGVPELDEAIYLPVTLVQISTAPEPAPASPTEQALGRANPTEAEAPQDIATSAAGETSAGNAVEKARTDPLRASLLRLRANVERTATPKLKSSVAAVLAAQKREIADRVRLGDRKRLRQDRQWFSASKWDKALHDALAPHLSGMAETVSGHIAIALPKPGKADGSLGPASTAAVERALTRGAARVTKINETTRTGIAQLISDGIDEGLSPAELGDVIEGWSGFDEYRAELIARTELMDAYNGAALGSYSDAGIGEVQAIDGDDDEQCASRNGQTFSVDDADSIEDHPNGTLDWVPVIA